MIILTDEDIVKTEGHNSRGNQIKFKKTVNDKVLWYKLDFSGYESLSEYTASRLLQNSNLESFVIYWPEFVMYNGVKYTGCVSENFVPDTGTLITASRLFESYFGKGVEDFLHSDDPKTRIERFIEGTVFCTKMDEAEIGRYLTSMAELDALILNDDRHFNNIAFLYIDGQFMLPPIFDNGAAFMSDKTYYIDDDTSKVTAKPFSAAFDMQKKILENMFGTVLSISIKGIDQIFTQNDHELFNIDDIDKVKRILSSQIKKYPDLININADRIKAFQEKLSQCVKVSCKESNVAKEQNNIIL